MQVALRFTGHEPAAGEKVTPYGIGGQNSIDLRRCPLDG